jgi:hypothetical protein
MHVAVPRQSHARPLLAIDFKHEMLMTGDLFEGNAQKIYFEIRFGVSTAMKISFWIVV